MKRPLFIRWGLGGGAIALMALGGTTFYFFHQLTQIPETLKPTPNIASRSQRHQALQEDALAIWRTSGARSQPSDRGRVFRLNAEELNAFIAFTLARDLEPQGDPQVLRGSQVEIVENALKTTTLIDLSQVTEASLNGSGKLSLLRRLLKIPGLRDRPIAIAVEGQPTVRDRALVLDDPIIWIGKIRLTKPEAIQWLGISEAILQERLNQDWWLPIDLNRVQIGKDAVSADPMLFLELEGSLTAW